MIKNNNIKIILIKYKNILTTKVDSVIIKSIQKRYNNRTSQKDI